MLVIPEEWKDRFRGKDVFREVFALQGKVYRDLGDRKTLRFNMDGRGYFAKLHRGIGYKEYIKDLLRFRRPVVSAENEWDAILRLEKLGIRTTPLVAYGRKGRNPVRRKSFVITEEIPNTVSLENLCRSWPSSPPDHRIKYALIREVALIAKTLHEAQMNHRDLYLCHFLLDVSKGPENLDPLDLRLYLIDLHRLQTHRRLAKRWKIKDLAGLYFSSMDAGLHRRDLLRFVRIYTGRPLKQSLQGNRIFWRRVRKRAKALYRKLHGKPRRGLLKRNSKSESRNSKQETWASP